MVGNLARRSFSTLVAAAFADGQVNEQERQVLHRRATELGIPQRMVDDLMEQGRQGKVRVAVPANRHARGELMNDLIEVVCADGRLEAPEHHLLAKFASHIGMDLPDLRAMVRERLQRPASPPQVEPRLEPEIRILEEQPSEPKPEKPPEPEPMRGPEIASLEPPSPLGERQSDSPMLSPGPFRFEDHESTRVKDIPPVTLGLLKQSIHLESSDEVVQYTMRMMDVTKLEAQEIIQKILRAYPEIKPQSQAIRSGQAR